jgi:hypothetical protein
MSRTNPVMLLAVMAAVLAVPGGTAVLTGAVRIDDHDGDVMHLLDMVLRQASGQRPHLDYMTPLGLLSTWPIAALVAAGLPGGLAVVLAQLLVAVLLVAPTFWVAWSRFPAPWSFVFGVSVLVLCLALIHGGSGMTLSMAMHYNRWAWALAFLAVAVGLVPPLRPGGLWADVLVLGLAMAALVLLKVTFTVALALPLIGIMLARQSFALLALSVLVAALALGLAVAWLGLDFWLAYAADLIATAQSETRAYPGPPPLEIAASAALFPAIALSLAAVVVLRTGGHPAAGLGVLLLVPAFIYITAQNFGNDPKWTWLLALMLLALRPAEGQRALGGLPARASLSVLAAGLFMVSAPSFVNMAASPFRNLAEGGAGYVPLVPREPRLAGIEVWEENARRYNVVRAADGPGSGLEWARAGANRPDLPVLKGETLEDCALNSGLLAQAQTIAADLAANGFGGAQIVNADLLNLYWMFEPSLVPLQGGAPWLYDGMPGWPAAEYVLVPHCPVHPRSRALWVSNINALLELGTVELAEVRRTPLYTLHEIIR